MSSYTPQQFVADWRDTPLSERNSYQIHFNAVCRLVGHEAPGGSGTDEKGLQFLFERAVKKATGAQGFADVYYENHFAIEYKAPGKYTDLTEAYQQLLQYREKLNNPPLLVVTDIDTWEIHTNWPNTEKRIYRFSHADIARRPSILQHLRDLFSAPDRLHPNRNTEQVTADAAEVFETIANNMRDWQAEPDRIAHFLTKLVFCLFAEDVSLLPTVSGSSRGIFSEIIAQTRTDSNRFKRYTADLFQAMADGGDVLFQQIPYFNGSLFDDVAVEDVQFEALLALEKAARLNWESVEPAIFGTLFERSLDPAKRSQLGAHYTSREDILLIVEPVLMQPLRREWEAIQQEAAPIREKYETALAGSNRRQITTYGNQLEALRQRMLTRLREITVLDPACGSGNFLYVSLQLLMDMEKAVINSDLFLGMTQALPAVHPRQMYGIEKDPIAHALASIVVWIGYLQWHQNNGYTRYDEPILNDLSQNIVCRDAILEITTPLPSIPSPMRWGGEAEQSEAGVGSNLNDESGTAFTGWAQTHTDRALYDKIKQAAREMRQEPTPAEEHLWQALRKQQLHGYKFRRQHPIDRFIVDFFCADARLVVEVDGPIHAEQVEYDELRQAFIESLGLRVLRITNDAVLQQTAAVLERIGEELLNPSLGSPPSEASPWDQSSEAGVGTETDWPAVDVIVSNPPFLGGQKLLRELGEDYVGQLRKTYQGRVHASADLVVYWFERARKQIAERKVNRVGLLSTQAIRAGFSRLVLDNIKKTGEIFMAWDDRAWILEGAAVRVSMIGFDNGTQKEKMLNGENVSEINSDLTAGTDVTKAYQLAENSDLIARGIETGGPFELENGEAIALRNIQNALVIVPILNARDVTDRNRRRWLIDFDQTPHIPPHEYPEVYKLLRQKWDQAMQQKRKPVFREEWWKFRRSGEKVRAIINSGSRYIATPRVAKHRTFVWVDAHSLVDSRLFAIDREDDYFFGVLHSRIHEVWSLATSSRHGAGNDPTYNNTTCFETFPFPWSPGQEDESSPAYAAISAAAQQLNAERSAWLNPDSLPDASGRAGEGLEEGKKYKDRTLTNLYNALNGWRGLETIKLKPAAADFAPRLDALHQLLDRAVCAAYGWDDMGGAGYAVNIYTPAGEEEILKRLLALNLERAE